MAGWFSWYVLAACAVITQSLPRPDEYEIPDVPYGKRAQYYVLHDDGDFKYGYDTGTGAYESAVKMGAGDLTGYYGFNNALGETVRVDYTAGVDGFRPRGVHLPAAADDSVVRAASSSSSLASSSIQLSTSASPYSFGGNAQTGSRISAVSHSAVSQEKPVEEANVRSANNLDGSYSFSYDNSDSSRQESGDSNNNVVGQYSFVAGDGARRRVQYRAGSATGFIAEGDGIPVAPEVPVAPSPHSAVAPVAVVPNVEAISQGSSSVLQGYTYNAPAIPSLYATPSISSSSSHIRSDFNQEQPRGDASYSFKYETDNSARQESADKDLNVKGSYSYVGDDGENRRVDYIAGSGTGFVAKGSHLPVAPEVGVAAPSLEPVKYSAPALTPSVALTRSSAQSSGGSRDASYQFSYDTDDSSRSESAVKNLNVKGDYSFDADDGQKRTVSFVAGSGTGFVAQGSHLPVAPEASAAHISATRSAASQASSYQSQSASQYAGASSSDVSGTGIKAYSASSNEPRGDASYRFSYQTGDSSRSENADRDLNVKGEYSFTGDDGIVRTVTYHAGAGTGFVAEGDHLPSDTPISPTFTSSRVYSAAPSTGSHSTSLTSQGTAFKSSQTGQASEANVAVTRNSDGSYSFSYQNHDSSRSENADANNNVVGQYSFTGHDGALRKVNYIAGSATGFLAEGDHLPKDTQGEVSAKVRSGDSRTASQALLKSSQAKKSAATSYTGVSAQEGAYIQSSANTDGSYSFSYTNADSSRSESGDANNNVVGQYSFVADDGQNRQVRYKAGANTGFVAEGDGIPVAPEVSGSLQSASLQRDGSAVPSSSVVSNGYSYTAPAVPVIATLYGVPLPSLGQVAAPRSSSVSHTGATSGVTAYSGSNQAHESTSGSQSGGRKGDASYSFAYNDGNSARKETANNNLDVKGTYSFVADDGVKRTVDYIAGSGTGFVATGDHLPVQEKDLASTSSQSSSSTFRTAGSASHSGIKFSSDHSASSASARSGSHSQQTSARQHGSSSQLIGDVNLRQYDVPGRSKFGYVFTQV